MGTGLANNYPQAAPDFEGLDEEVAKAIITYLTANVIPSI
jgi:hypothetical protein